MRRWVTSPASHRRRACPDAGRAERSQRWLAERLGKPPSYVAKIEVGARRVDIVEVVAVARALGVVCLRYSLRSPPPYLTSRTSDKCGRGRPQEQAAFRARSHTTYLSGVEIGRRIPTVLVLGCALLMP